jgi:hypothetical protein
MTGYSKVRGLRRDGMGMGYSAVQEPETTRQILLKEAIVNYGAATLSPTHNWTITDQLDRMSYLMWHRPRPPS